VVGSLDPCLFFFFFFSIGLLASEISLDEEDETEKTLQVNKAKKILLVKKVKDQHEVDVLGGKCLQTNHLLHSVLPNLKETIPVIQL
jgi:hypothetical protein